MSKFRKPLVIAHRGASGCAPENTLASVKIALSMFVDVIEIDVHQSVEGIPVVIHDRTLDRTTTGKGEVGEKTINELKCFDAGSWYSDKYKGEKIPTLESVLNIIDGKVILLIELKHGSDIYPNIEQNVLDIISKYNAASWCILQSFDSAIVEKFKTLGTEVELHKLITGQVNSLPVVLYSKLKLDGVFTYKGVKAINPSHKYLNRNIVDSIHEKGMKVFTWTVNEADDMRKMIAAGVDGIITNYPEKLIDLLKNENHS